MQKRLHSREFKLEVVRQIESGQKQAIEVCKEYDLDQSVVSRWRKEYRKWGEEFAFLPREETLTQESLERRRAWDRDYYQRHKAERQAANYGRRVKLYEYLQQVKEQASCAHCDENHPATLQFHHRDPSQKEFNISAFVAGQWGGIDKLKQEIEKCDIICANCHLKYHYEHDHKQSHIALTYINGQLEQIGREIEQEN